MQDIFDELYMKSKRGEVFSNLYDIIVDERNIKLAYRNIKSNKGSETAGVNHTTIKDWKNISTEDYVRYTRKRLQNYFPHKVRRVEILKPNGKIRPLGIPTMEDRLIQQCIKQVLEPILEAKFYPLSFGFRPNRGTMHAINEFMRMVNRSKLYYVIDIDIKGFFDNVNHAKLLKQLWSLGIRDKRVISIISKMLKAEIKGIGIPTKGTPQGGILSPLLSNAVLNELDWWIDSQWKSFEAKEIKLTIRKDGSTDRGNIYTKLRSSTNLKEMYIVRYADDFKILCRYKNDSLKTFEAIKKWLKERLDLEINDEKSNIVNITKQSSEFLGLRFKAKRKSGKWVINSHISEKSKQRSIEKIKKCILEIKKNATPQNVLRYNSTVMGIQNYFDIATHVNIDCSEIENKVRYFRYNQLKGVMSEKGVPSRTYTDRYKGYNYKKQFVAGMCLFPIPAIKHKNPVGFSQGVCDYTQEGRNRIHNKLKINVDMLHYIMENPLPNDSTELADNRISKYSAQWGKCYVTGEELYIGEMEIHHIIPKEYGGDDKFQNLVWVTTSAHSLIHATTEQTIEKYLQIIKLDNEQLDKLNKLRIQSRNGVIEQC